MSIVKLDKVNLTFSYQREKRIKDVFIRGDEAFNDVNLAGQVHAIKDLDLVIHDGERVSIVGHNGAGKSTLLKIISGIYQPTSGSVDVHGVMSSMFELSTGFEMEQSGWDNIYLRGLMLGESPKNIKAKMREVAEFSELGEFLNMPVKYYSSGMFIRLAFSVSTAINPEILLLDEVVGAGDAGFMKKAQIRMKSLVETSSIMVLVTHGMKDAIELTNRCIWMDRGRIMMDGNPEAVTTEYLSYVKSTNED